MDSLVDTKPVIIALDDSIAVLEILEKELKNEFEVTTCSGFTDFFNLLDEKNPDVVLLDMVMPEGSGLDVCKKIKTMIKYQTTPVIFLTSLEDSVNEELGFQAGAVDYIRKPFNIPVLKARIRTHSELKKMRDYLQELSSHDSLTGVRNKRAFIEEFHIAWIKALRSKNPLSLLIMDIDFFKDYNDYYGHVKGDECLKKIAEAIKEALPKEYTFFRFGGEEFVILAKDTDGENSKKLAEEVKKTVEALNIPHNKSKISKRVTLSIGVVTTIARSKWLPDDLLEAADSALYKAKENGRNRIETTRLSD